MNRYDRQNLHDLYRKVIELRNTESITNEIALQLHCMIDDLLQNQVSITDDFECAGFLKQHGCQAKSFYRGQGLGHRGYIITIGG